MATIRFILFCLLVIVIMPGNTQCKSNFAEDHVKEFYQWYIHGFAKISIDSDLSSYADECVVSVLRIMYNRDYFHADYFTKSQDCWDEWLDVMVVHKEMKINDETSIVPISFKWSENQQHHLLVFVRKEKDGWRIIKVSGTKYFFE
ncbi:YqhG/Tai3 family protein [Fundidesulfovibrio butyratiphilus]